MSKTAKQFFTSLNPSLLFIFSLLCLPGIVFQQSLICLWIDLALFALLCGLKKGKLRILPPLIIFVSIVFFNMFKNDGLVLFSFFSFKITQGALYDGLKKSGILLAMVFVSQYAVSRDLYLPGKAGGFLSRVFWYFDKLSEKNIENQSNSKVQKAKLHIFIFQSVHTLIERTDERLLHVFFDSPPSSNAHTKKTPVQKSGAFLRFCISVLPLFPVYLLLIFARLGFFPV